MLKPGLSLQPSGGLWAKMARLTVGPLETHVLVSIVELKAPVQNAHVPSKSSATK